MAAFLVPVDPGLCVIPLEKAILLIGRQADCDVSITASRKISRKHCCIAIVNDNVVVRDLGSTNGVAVNGAKIEREARLRLGDELTIGDVRFRLQTEPTAKRSAAPPPAEKAPPAKAAVPLRGAVPPPPPSMDFPVALADEGHDFVVEPSYPQLRPSNATESDHYDSGPLAPLGTVDERDHPLPLSSDSL